MPLGVAIVEGKEHSGSLITARLAMEFGPEVFGVPGNATRGSELRPEPVDQVEDMIEALSTPVRAVLLQAEVVGSEQRNSLMENGLTST